MKDMLIRVDEKVSKIEKFVDHYTMIQQDMMLRIREMETRMKLQGIVWSAITSGIIGLLFMLLGKWLG